MSSSLDVVLTQDAIKLKRIDQLIVKLILEWNIDELFKTIQEFMDLRKKIKKDLIDYPTAKIHDTQAQEILSKIIQEEPFQADNFLKALENKTGESYDFDKLEYDEIEELSDLFYSWFSHYEYLEGLYEIGSLIVGFSIPDTLKSYVSEARTCYAFQQYNAVYGLCRTILEIAIRHRCERKGIIKHQKGKIVDFDVYRPGELINKATRGPLRDKVKEIYSDTSALLHGRKTVNSDDAKKMFKDTLRVVQDLYGH
ncbi:MAG: hypothetical protein IMF10_07575 [Proteobacteria bacterium]|nr:hypothetical protein [Pseudomonadota bacterium]